MIYDMKKIIGDALNEGKVNKFKIRPYDLNDEFKDKKEAVIGNGKYALWGYIEVVLLKGEEWRKGDVFVDVTGKEYKHPMYRKPGGDNIHEYDGYYPIGQKNLAAAVDIVEEDEAGVVLKIDKYQVKLRYEKTEYVTEIVSGGYRGAATMREYLETINEPIIVSHEPLYDVYFDDKLVMSHIMHPYSVTLENLSKNGEGVTFDYLHDVANHYKKTTISLSEKGCEVIGEVPTVYEGEILD